MYTYGLFKKKSTWKIDEFDIKNFLFPLCNVLGKEYYGTVAGIINKHNHCINFIFFRGS
jgi:hypothetical protein